MRGEIRLGFGFLFVMAVHMRLSASSQESGSLYGSIRHSSPSIRLSEPWQQSSTGCSPPEINTIEADTTTTTNQAASKNSNRSIVTLCPKPPSCKQMCWQRIPKGRGLMLVLVMLVIERYMLYGAVDQVLSLIPELHNSSNTEGFSSFLRIFLFYCVSRLFYPIGGFLADVYMGRCRVIHLSLWLYWIAFALLTIATILQELGLGHSTIYSTIYNHVLPITAFVFLILASGGFESTLIPFGADQMEAASSSEISSYFYWYYTAIQVGPLLNIVVNSVISTWVPAHKGTLQVFADLVVATFGLVLHNLLQHWYFKNALRENCIKLVLKVLWYAARVKRRMPQYRRAFRYGEGKIRRIELAKRQYDGKFSGDQVEDVKTFCMVCLILFCLGGYFFSQAGSAAMLTYRINATFFEATSNSSGFYNNTHFISSNLFLTVNALVGLLFVPLVNHILIPCVPSLSMRGRMAIGMAIHILSIISAACIEACVQSLHITPLHTELWFILPVVLITIPEILTTMSALEFVYAQSPESMKGMLTGLLYFIYGIFNGGATTAFYFFIKASSEYSYFYVILLVFAVLGMCGYIIAACLYVNRLRPTQESEEGEERHLFYNRI